jgi:hypothetical protein
VTSRSRRVLTGFGIAIVCIAVGIGLGVAGADWASSNVVGSYVSPGGLLISADQRTIASTVTRCASGSLEASETPQTITVRLHLLPEMMMAPGVCAAQSFSTTLKAPVGSRTLIDGITHAKLPSFDGGRILRPSYLPAGFIHRYDTASFPEETVANSSAGCVQIFTQGDSYDESIWITQDVGGVWQAPYGVSSTPIVVHGHAGTAIPGEIEWTESGQLFTIRSITYAYATLSQQELIAIGDSLH